MAGHGACPAPRAPSLSSQVSRPSRTAVTAMPSATAGPAIIPGRRSPAARPRPLRPGWRRSGSRCPRRAPRPSPGRAPVRCLAVPSSGVTIRLAADTAVPGQVVAGCCAVARCGKSREPRLLLERQGSSLRPAQTASAPAAWTAYRARKGPGGGDVASRAGCAAGRRGEPVADAPYCDALAVPGAELAAQAVYVHVDRARALGRSRLQTRRSSCSRVKTLPGLEARKSSNSNSRKVSSIRAEPIRLSRLWRSMIRPGASGPDGSGLSRYGVRRR